MSKRIKIIAFAILFSAGTTLSTVAQTSDIRGLQTSLQDFSGDLAKALPFNASLGLNWADAYIGRLFPSIPPRLGAGVALGFTTMDLPAMKALTNSLGYTIPNDSEKLIFPAYTIETRLGGILFPWDLGFKFGYLPYREFPGNNVDTYSLIAGGDVRFSVLDGKTNLALPNISIGLGVNYLRGGIEGYSNMSRSISFGSASLNLSNPDVNLLWNTFALDLKAQISKSLLIFTPYLGVGGSFAWSSAGYSVSAPVTVNGAPINQTHINEINSQLRSNGLVGMTLSPSGISSTSKNSGYNLRAYGGSSINFLIFRLDLTALYSFLDGNYGASLGLRIQF